MIDVIPLHGDNLVAFHARGQLTHEDYRDTIVPHLEAAMQHHGRLRVLCVLDDAYQGITPGALWDELKLDAKHRKEFERVAIVTDDPLVRAAVHMTRWLFAGDVRLYRVAERAQAEHWLKEAVPV